MIDDLLGVGISVAVVTAVSEAGEMNGRDPCDDPHPGA